MTQAINKSTGMRAFLDTLPQAVFTDSEAKQAEFDLSTLQFDAHPLYSMLMIADVVWDYTEYNVEYDRIFVDHAAQFSTVDPSLKEFAAAVDFTQYYNQNMLRIPEPTSPNTHRELVEECMLFFYDKIVQRRLRGDPVSEWQRDFLDFYSMCEQRQCRGRHLKRFCKLPQLYLNSQRFGKMIETLTSLPGEDYASDVVFKLIPLQTINRNTVRQRNKTILYFRTEKNNLFELRTPHNPLLEDIVFNAWREPIEVHAPFAMVANNTDYESFYYYSASDIDFLSTPKKH